MEIIHYIERNVHGAYVVVGIIGTRQYYGYTKKEAREKYTEEAKHTAFFNE